jgi:thiol-disulfide isomerase/thioredoxin
MSEMIQPKSYEELAELVQNGRHMFFFTADWCGDCVYIKPQMPEIIAENPDFTFVEVDRDQFMDLAIEWQIMGIPSFVAIQDGKEIGRYVDKFRKTKEQINAFINGLKEKA